MRDKEFLQWLHTRLEDKYGVDPRTDYMEKLRAITNTIPKFRDTTSENEEIPKFKKVNLKTGMKVFLRNGREYTVLLRAVAECGMQDIIQSNESWDSLSNYTNDLIYLSECRSLDIVKVVILDNFIPISQKKITLWER